MANKKGQIPNIDQGIEATKKYEIKRILRESSIAFFGTLAIIGLVVSFYFLTQMNDQYSVTGNVIGLKEGNYYGLVIVVVLLLILSILSIMWFRKFRRDYLEHRT